MAEETRYTANTGWTTISTANSNLNGTGTLGTVLTAGSNGTLIKSVTFKAQSDTLEGMVRLFVDDLHGNVTLIKEIPVPPILQAPITPTFEIKLDLDLALNAGFALKASTEKASAFNVIAEGLDWVYSTSLVRTDTTQYTGNTGTNTISVANPNLNGTGSVTAVYVTGASATFKGSSVKTISIKSAVTPTTPGMVRLYLYDNVSTTKLFTEVFVNAKAQSAVDESFEHTIVFENDFDIQSGWSITASTEQGQSFHITVEGQDWKYLA